MCLSVIVKPRYWGGPGLLGAVAPWKKKSYHCLVSKSVSAAVLPAVTATEVFPSQSGRGDCLNDSRTMPSTCKSDKACIGMFSCRYVSVSRHSAFMSGPSWQPLVKSLAVWWERPCEGRTFPYERTRTLAQKAFLVCMSVWEVHDSNFGRTPTILTDFLYRFLRANVFRRNGLSYWHLHEMRCRWNKVMPGAAYLSSFIFLQFIPRVQVTAGAHPWGGCRAAAPPPKKTPQNRNFKNTNFVDIMISKVLLDFPFSRSQPLKSADD